MSTPLRLSQFDYHLPEQRIAQRPVEPRDSSRLLIVAPTQEAPFIHSQFNALPSHLMPGDVLVVNQTQVLPARLHCRRPSGGKVELLFYRPLHGDLSSATVWEAIGKPGRVLQPGARLITADNSVLTVVGRDNERVQVQSDGPLLDLLNRLGRMPLPPYIKRKGVDADASDPDAQAYQTVFAKEAGAMAAPTASLHFTDSLLQQLRDHGIYLHTVVLHVGLGTFLPIREEHQDDIRQHQMHAEWYSVPQATQDAIALAKQQGRRVIAVGTTSLRALETWALTGQAVGESTLFVYPGFEFKVVQGLVTNFHVPRSTLLLLVSAFAGRDTIFEAYQEALRLDYRFLSYGDGMLLWQKPVSSQ